MITKVQATQKGFKVKYISSGRPELKNLYGEVSGTISFTGLSAMVHFKDAQGRVVNTEWVGFSGLDPVLDSPLESAIAELVSRQQVLRRNRDKAYDDANTEIETLSKAIKALRELA